MFALPSKEYLELRDKIHEEFISLRDEFETQEDEYPCEQIVYNCYLDEYMRKNMHRIIYLNGCLALITNDYIALDKYIRHVMDNKMAEEGVRLCEE